MAEEELKESGEDEALEEVGNTLPETHSRRKEESVRQDPVVDLKV